MDGAAGQAGRLTARRATLSSNSVARLAADGAATLAGVGASIVTARWLGPAGKGVFAALGLLVTVGAGLATAGLGQSAVIEVRRRGQSRQAVLDSFANAGLMFGLVAGGLLAGGAWAWLGTEAVVAIAAGAVTVPFIVTSNVLGGVLDADGSIARSSLGHAVSSVGGALAVVVLVAALDLGLDGAMLAGAVGGVLPVALFVILLRRDGIRWHRAVSRPLLRRGLHYGVRVQGAAMLQLATARIDLLLVLALAGQREAGLYSIGLTLALVVSAIPRAVAFAAFPGLAGLTGGGTAELARITRVAILPTVVGAFALGASAPVLVPLLFGSAYVEAVWPAVVLTVSGVAFGVQTLLARGRAGLDEPGVTLWSFAWSTLVLVAADVVLVPWGGLLAAAAVAVVSPLVGVVVGLRGGQSGGIRLAALIPRPDDVRVLVVTVRRLVSRGPGPQTGTPSSE